jgi:type II secretory ATPase GspE/PulE/Tfp pilus assembly ATPase PilB-like protein
MDSFVNLRESGFLLPAGCKDLVDVLRLRAARARETPDPVETFVREMLLRGEAVGATEILIDAPMIHDGDCRIAQRINGTLHHVSTIRAGLRGDVVAKLLRMTGLAEPSFPVHGAVVLQLKRRQLKWKLEMESPAAICQLAPLDE